MCSWKDELERIQEERVQEEDFLFDEEQSAKQWEEEDQSGRRDNSCFDENDDIDWDDHDVDWGEDGEEDGEEDEDEIS